MFSILGQSFVVGGSGTHINCRSMAPMRVGARGSVTINGQEVKGPCTVQVKDGVLLIDGGWKR
jgi:hypothetical protein